MGLFPVREKMGIIISHAILKVGINQRLPNPAEPEPNRSDLLSLE
jgi:hypothetical protein